ncbi:DUF2147 domain-containing protein [Maritalea sp.]|uniref:DUF2147 domain-containing protein n=1 Tax=Maritalea sp. TaxID=2003361 RepID=UPI003EF12677
MFGKKPKDLLLASTLVLFAIFSASAAFSADPTGVWLTKDKAEITIKRCGADYCGIVSKPAKPGLRDIRNPDPALNGRPIMGMPLLRVSKEGKKGVLPGQLYNPLDGKMYEGTLELRANNKLRIRGCVLKIFCLHEDWVKIGS